MMRATFLIGIGLLCGTQQATAQASVSEVRKLYVEDQRDRGVPMADDGGPAKPGDEKKSHDYDAIEAPKRDALRRDAVRRLIGGGKLVTGQDYKDASFLFQHSDVPSDYLLAHVLAIQAVLHGDATARWIAAATLDRYLQSIGQKQIFGTQYSDEKYAFYMEHRSEPDVLEKLKALPKDVSDRSSQNPYNRALLPATTRTDFCVPELAVQEQYIADSNAGKDVPLPRLANCPR